MQNKKYTVRVELFGNGADKAMMEIPECATIKFAHKEVVRFQEVLLSLQQLGISKATLSEGFDDFEFCDENGEESFPMDDFDPAHITIYESGLIEITMLCLTKNGEITTDPTTHLQDAINFFGIKAALFEEKGGVDANQEMALQHEENGTDFILTGDNCYITVNNLTVYVKKDEEGVAVDVWPVHQEDGDPIASAWALYSEGEVDSDKDSEKAYCLSCKMDMHFDEVGNCKGCGNFIDGGAV
jgi:hypothetical protein